MKKIIPIMLMLSLVAAACGDDEETTPTTTTPTDRSPAYVESVKFMFLESYPVQVRATVSGNLPTPCHELRWELETTDPTSPILQIWSTADADTVCAQVLEPFEETIDIGSFETGSYQLMIDGESHPFEI